LGGLVVDTDWLSPRAIGLGWSITGKLDTTAAAKADRASISSTAAVAGIELVVDEVIGVEYKLSAEMDATLDKGRCSSADTEVNGEDNGEVIRLRYAAAEAADTDDV
jgi:hypothetical protein